MLNIIRDCGIVIIAVAGMVGVLYLVVWALCVASKEGLPDIEDVEENETIN